MERFWGWWKGRLKGLYKQTSPPPHLKVIIRILDSRLQQKVFVKLETNWVQDFSDKSLRNSACDTWNLPRMLNRAQETSRDFAPPFGVSQCMALCILRHVQEGQRWWEKENYLHFDYFWRLDSIDIFFFAALKCTFLPIERGMWGFPMKVFWGCSQLRKWMISEVSGWSVAFHELSRSFFFLQQKPNEIWVSWTIMYTTKEVITFSETFLKPRRKLRISEDFLISVLGHLFRVPTTGTMGPGTTWIHWVRSHEIITFRFCRILWITWIFFFALQKSFASILKSPKSKNPELSVLGPELSPLISHGEVSRPCLAWTICDPSGRCAGNGSCKFPTYANCK